jgi:ABC-type cobalamin/Fe3+-siderophores transport system ATPase subunit
MPQLLSATDVSFAYADGSVLKNVGVTLDTGEIVALIGPNGSGKSTLLLALLGFLRAAGTIKWENRPITQWRQRDLARYVAYLPQSPRHDPGQTVLDVLKLGRFPYWGAFGLESSADDAVLTDVAKMLHIDDLLDRPMEKMSGGQRQRVFIGRCLAQEPKALLLDEPNTFLDLKYQVELSDLLRQLARSRNIAVLMASHELNIAGAGADKIVLLRDGVVAATGNADAVLRPEILSTVYDVPIQRFDGAGGHPIVVPVIK